LQNREGLAVADQSTGFLGRWARRKAQARQPGLARTPDETAAMEHADLAAVNSGVVAFPEPRSETEAPGGQGDHAQPEPAPAPALSLEDARSLTTDSDFRPFMARGVGGDVRNAAMKKLFSDPHFNVMDGLDIYIDDYSKADPIPEAMLRQMVGAQLLGLFDEQPDRFPMQDSADPEQASTATEGLAGIEAAPDAGADSDAAVAAPSVSEPLISLQHRPEALDSLCSSASQEDHANTDLRLQPDHAARQPEAGRGGQ
jgi:Protein of unknown function (DUF3306)